MAQGQRSSEVAEGVDVQIKWYHEWVKENVPDQSGRVAVVTGANSGTGFWCAAALAQKGARVVLACRSVERAEAARSEILAMHPQAALDVLRLDNMDLGSVSDFAASFKDKYDKLDLLINNAGIMAQPEVQSKDGHDVQFQTNHLAHFLLTALLWDRILAASSDGRPARVVQHSSCAHWMGGAKFDRNKFSDPPASARWCCLWNCMLPCLPLPRGPWRRYMMSKLCNVLFGLELQRRIDAAGLSDKVLSTMCHPGYASTQLQVVAGNAGSFKGWKSSNGKYAQSAADGAMPLLMAAVGKGVNGGAYFGPSRENEMKGPPKVCKTGVNAKSEAMAKDLWSYSEEQCNLKFVLQAAP